MESRKRLRPWLWRHIDAGDYGLRWVNKEDGTFRMPWPHRSSRCWNKDDCQVFKEWARFTNKYRDGDLDDYPGWKTRMRTALTKLSKDFEEVHDLHKKEDFENPYKVYRFKNIDNQRDLSESSPSPGFSPSSSQSVDSSVSSPYSNLSPHSILSGASPFVMSGNIPNIIESHDGENEGKAKQLNNNMAAPQFYDALSLGGDMTNQQEDFDNVEDTLPSLPSSCSLPSDLMSVESDNLISEKLPSNEINCYKSDPEPKFEETSQNSQIAAHPGKKPIFYEIIYLDEVVKNGYLYDDIYHFNFGNIPDSDFFSPIVFGPKEAQRIEFPDITGMKRSINHQQHALFQKILLEMNRGFLLKCLNGDIYAQRLCRTRIFATSSTMANEVLDRKSKAPSKIFDLAQFRENHLDQNQRPPVALLTFAQELQIDSFKTLLMQMKLTSLEAQDLLPSASSGNILQISDFNSADREMEQKLKTLSLRNDLIK